MAPMTLMLTLTPRADCQVCLRPEATETFDIIVYSVMV